MKLKNLFFIILFFWSVFGFSQVKRSYIQDIREKYIIQTIDEADFKSFESPINNGLNNGIYWLKITNVSSEKTTIQIPNNRIVTAVAYQNNQLILPNKKERFITFSLKNSAKTYIKINVNREAFIPVEIKSTEKFIEDEKRDFLFLGFYYGFTVVIMLINILYFFNFKDETFLFYAFFLGSISFGFSISDGIYNFNGFSERTITILEVINHLLVLLFSILFGSKYLETKRYFPKTIYFELFLFVFATFFGITFLVTDNHFWYVVTELAVFTIFFYYWIFSVLLFKKNFFSKIFVFAYFFILILGPSFYVTKLLGLPIYVSAYHLKLSAFFEMILLSFAVIYRMKIIQDKNIEMRDEILQYTKEIKLLSRKLASKSKDTNSDFEELNLTTRENEILNFITLGKANKQIAEELIISINTVKYHVKNIYDKLNIKSRKELQKLS